MTQSTSRSSCISHIVCDLDGTVAEQNDILCKLVREWTGADFYPEDIHGWNHDIPGTDMDIVDAIKRAYNTERYLDEMEPIPGAIPALNAFNDAGAKISVVTHRPDSVVERTREWVEEHDVPYETYICDFDQDKAAVGGDVMIDDYYGHIEDAANAGQTGIMFLRHFNHDKIPTHENVYTAADWCDKSPLQLAKNPARQWMLIQEFIEIHIESPKPPQ